MLFNHLNRGPTILGDLINISAFHKAHTDIGMSKTVKRSRLTIPVKFQPELGQDGVKHLSVVIWEYPVRWRGVIARLNALIRPNSPTVLLQ